MLSSIATPTPAGQQISGLEFEAGDTSTPADAANRLASKRNGELLALISSKLAPQRRVVHAGDMLYRSPASASATCTS